MNATIPSTLPANGRAARLAAMGALLLFGLAACKSPAPPENTAATVGGGFQTAIEQGPPSIDELNRILAAEIGDRVFFGFDRYDLTPEATAVLERQAEWLKARPGIRIQVEGHADERGTRDYNLALGQRRAASVRAYLVAMGVAGERIDTISYGKERPVVLGADESAWSQNRRAVSIVVTQG